MSAQINPTEKVAAAEFCTNCRAIDFDEIFSIDPSSIASDFDSPGRKVADFVGDLQELSRSSSSCPLCRLYATVVRPHVRQRGVDKYSLIVRSTAELHENNNAFTGEKRTADLDTLPRLILQVFPEHFDPFMASFTDMFLFDQTSLLDGRNEASKPQSVSPTEGGSCGYINADILRSFVDYCCKNHADSPICGDGNQIQGSELPSFKVIDVESLRIICAGLDPVYAALSYRWGEQAYDPSCQPFDENGDLKDASALPLVISDALKVTKDMGFRYCWVDRYCIPQNDPSAMEVQFGHMDQIYRLAAVTIISDSHCPFLPGVTQKLETAVLPVRVGECNISVGSLKFDDMQHRVRWSPWAGRAWTYQEGLFSRRRLFFTDEGVYYECGRMASGEAGFAAPQPRWNLREEDKAPWLSPATSPKREQGLLKCLSTYSKRNLTFDKDKLAAALGIFHAFETPGQLMRHYLGTPVLKLVSAETGSVKDLIIGLMKGMLFYRGSARCYDLPSWSWVGWTGEISFFNINLKNPPTSETSSKHMIPHVKSELMDGTLLTWNSVANIQRLHATPISAISRYIHLDACTIQMHIPWAGFEEAHTVNNPVKSYIINFGRKEVDNAKDNMFPDPECRYNIMDIPGCGQIYVEIDMQRPPSRKLLDSLNGLSTGIVILSGHAGSELAIILVEPVGDVSGTMERFGIIKLVPDMVFFRPFINSQRQRIETEKSEGSFNDEDEYEDLSHLSDEQCKELGMPTWEEFMVHFWDAGQAKRRSIRLG